MQRERGKEEGESGKKLGDGKGKENEREGIERGEVKEERGLWKKGGAGGLGIVTGKRERNWLGIVEKIGRNPFGNCDRKNGEKPVWELWEWKKEKQPVWEL